MSIQKAKTTALFTPIM